MYKNCAFLSLLVLRATCLRKANGYVGSNVSEARHLNPKEAITCEVCEKVLLDSEFTCDGYVPNPALFDPDVSLPAQASKKNLMQALGSTSPPSRELWTSDGRIYMSDEAVSKILAHLNIKDGDGRTHKRAVDILKHPKIGLLTKARKKFCSGAQKRMKRMGANCKATWNVRDDQNVRQFYQESFPDDGDADNYCSCIMHAQNSGRYSNTPWEERPKCSSKMWSD